MCFLVTIGLKAFSGLNHPDLFTNDDNTKNSKFATVANTTENSDSDSDYEYFKVQKELEAKKEEVEIEEAEETDLKPSVTGNTFSEAIKRAIVEDELILPATVNQTFLIVPMKLRLVTLCSLIVEHCVLNKKGGKIIVFMATLEMVDYHSELLETVLTGEKVKVKKKDQEKNKGKKRKSKDDGDEVRFSCNLFF